MKTLKRMPLPFAVVIMVLLILLGIVFGNRNALQHAISNADTASQLAVVSAEASKRANTAKNLLVVARRNNVDATSVSALEDAIAALENARRADRLAQANSALSFSAGVVNDAIQATADERDRKLATGEMDNLISTNNIMQREANAYNERVEDVHAIYNRLPMRFLLGGNLPEVYQ